MLNGIGVVAAGKQASLTLCSKTRSCAPVIGNGANVCEGECEGLTRSKPIFRNHVANLYLTRCSPEEPSGLQGNETAETERSALSDNLLIYLVLRNITTVLQTIASDEIRVCVAN